MIRISVLTLFAVFATLGCSTFSWKEGPSRFSDKRRTGAKQNDSPEDLRLKIVSQAEDLLRGSQEMPEFGAGDLSRVLKKLRVAANWESGQGLNRLVEIARKRRAYRAEGTPRLGDIVLFHNQWDVNGNGENDDWNTGAGIVVKTKGERFEVVTRTGHGPRRVHVWPEKPSSRKIGGELVNSFVRVPEKSDPKDTRYLAGQLYAGFIDVDKLVGD